MSAWKFVSLACAVVAGVGAVAVAQAQEGQNPAGPACGVTVERTQPGGVFDVTRQVFEDGSCNCFVYTGPEGQAANVEAQVSSIVQSGRCPAARVMQVPGPGQGASAGAGNAGGLNAAVPIAGFAGAAAGIVILSSGSPSSP